jgi:SNF2 family DNA or RNA helicase
VQHDNGQAELKSMSVPHAVTSRPMQLTRESSVFRLVFGYSPVLVERTKNLPFARFDKDTRSWSVPVSAQSVEALRQMYLDGLTDVPVDDLMGHDEQPSAVREAILVSAGGARGKRPYLVHTAGRNDALFARLRAVPGALWDRERGAISYPAQAGSALAELVARGVLDDPERILQPAEVTVAFDGRTGEFSVRGDQRAGAVFAANFPGRDVMAVWKEKGLDVAFADEFSEEMYYGELARSTDGLQPEGLKIELFSYQRQTVATAVDRSGFAIFDQPGLGKTAQALSIAHEVMNNRHEVPRTVIVVPGAVRTHWKREIIRFTGTSAEDVVVISGDKASRKRGYEAAAEAKWLVLHYDVLHLDYDQISPLVKGAYLIADEAHRLKSPQAKRTKIMRQLRSRASRALALTGTPVENNPGEWFSVLSGFAVPGCLGSAHDFLNRYQYPGRFGGYEGARNLGELRDRSKPFYIRHLKSEVAKHLPPLRVKHLPLDVDPSYANVLRRAHREARDEIAAEALKRKTAGRTLVMGDELDDLESGAEMTAVGMLRALCSSPRLLQGSDAPSAQALVAAGLLPDADGPKLDELRHMANEMQAAGERLVVFTFSRRMADLIADRFTEDGVRYVLFTGATSHDERDRAVAAFTTAGTETDPGPTVFVATDAGSEGLNLGKCCSTLVNFDIPYKASTMEQRSQRIHRVDGTASSYLVVNFTLRGTIEEGLLRMVEHKADLTDALFGESGSRRRTTGRGGRGNVFEMAMSSWDEQELRS